MQVTSLGKIAVATPGTAVQVSADTNLRVARIRFQAKSSETGKLYVGTSLLVAATGVGVIAELRPAAGVDLSFEISDSIGGASIYPSQYWIDAQTATEGVIVSYWVE
jgi:hypothetical protein